MFFKSVFSSRFFFSITSSFSAWKCLRVPSFPSALCRSFASSPHIADLLSAVAVTPLTPPHGSLLALLKLLNCFQFSFSFLIHIPFLISLMDFSFCFLRPFLHPIKVIKQPREHYSRCSVQFQKSLSSPESLGGDFHFLDLLFCFPHVYCVGACVCVYTHLEERVIQTQYSPKQVPTAQCPSALCSDRSPFMSTVELMERARSCLSVSATFPFRVVYRDDLLGASIRPLMTLNWREPPHLAAMCLSPSQILYLLELHCPEFLVSPAPHVSS